MALLHYRPFVLRATLALALFAIAGQYGCQSTQTAMTSQPAYSTLASDRPLPSQDMKVRENHFKSRLPLGIGARFDLFVADTATGMSEVYNSYVKSMRQGKIFRNRSYELDYAILPKKGSAFNTKKKKNLFGLFTMKSNYKFQIGMSRRFRDFSDFLHPGFWLALGRYAPTPETPKQTSHPQMMWSFEDDADSITIDPYDIYRIDLNEITYPAWD